MAESKRDEVTSNAARTGDAEETAAGGKPGQGTGLTGGAEAVGTGADAGVTGGTRAAATGANLGETEAVGGDTAGGGPTGR